MSYAFPAAVMANTFSVTDLMVILGLSGNLEMAADFGIVHGAAITLFYSFSANARNILLNRQSAISPGLILGTRLLLFLPLALISLWLSVHFGRVEVLLAVVLVMRLCSEWIAELALGSAEVRQDLLYAKRFLALQIAAFLVVGRWLIGGLPHAMPILLLRLLQNHAHRDVFGPDVLVNILLVAAVPYVFYLLGRDALGFLYLLGSVLALLFYSSAIKWAPQDHLSPAQMQSRWIPPIIVISLLLHLS